MRIFDPFQELGTLRREIDRVFETAWPLGGARNAFLPARSPRNYPCINVNEDADKVVIEALAPGLDPEKIQIAVLRNQLTIAGEKPTIGENIAAEKYHRSERASGKFVRTFTLPAEVDDHKVSAEYRSGILRITLPKAETAKPRKIAVTVA